MTTVVEQKKMLFKKMTIVITLTFQDSNIIHFRERELVFGYMKEPTTNLR